MFFASIAASIIYQIEYVVFSKRQVAHWTFQLSTLLEPIVWNRDTGKGTGASTKCGTSSCL